VQQIRLIIEDRGAPKSAVPVAIATFATIVNRHWMCIWFWRE